MAYQLKYSGYQTGNTTVTVQDGTVYSALGGISLPGKNFSGYGQYMDQNILSMVENFAGSTVGPANPVTGQLWYDVNAGVLKVNSSTTNTVSWSSLATSGGSAVFDDITFTGTLTGNGGGLSGLNAANLSSGTIASARLSGAYTIDVTGNVTVTDNANLGDIGNITIAGGTAGQVLSTDGSGVLSWSTVGSSGISSGSSNVSIPVAGGNVNTSAGGVANVFVVTSVGANVVGAFDVTGDITAGNMTLTGNLTLPTGTTLDTADIDATGNVDVGGNLTVSGNTNLGPVGNVTITGGTSGQFLQTNGSGVLSWATVSGGGSVVISSTAPASPTTGTQWYNDTTGLLQIWNGTAWKLVNDWIVVSDTAPATPFDGQVWYDSLTSYRAAVWSSQAGAWVDLNPAGGGGGGASVDVTNTAPASPTTGTLWYNDTTGLFQIWNGTAWKLVNDWIVVSDVAPATPFNGQIWYDSLTSYRAFVWSTQAGAWIDLNPAGSAAPTTGIITGTAAQDYQKSATAPTTRSVAAGGGTLVEGDLWYDTSTDVLNVRSGAGTWLPSNGAVTGNVSAWVNFNGSGTVAIRGSFNVSSITDNGVGDYRVNFTTSMPNANYGFALSQGGISGTGLGAVVASGTTNPTPAAISIWCLSDQGTARVDGAYVSVSIIR